VAPPTSKAGSRSTGPVAVKDHVKVNVNVNVNVDVDVDVSAWKWGWRP
jgi:hypothetical protein